MEHAVGVNLYDPVKDAWATEDARQEYLRDNVCHVGSAPGCGQCDGDARRKIKQAIAAGRVEFDIPPGASLPSRNPPPDAITDPVFNHLSLLTRDGLALLRWGADHIGFGEITLRHREGRWRLDDESMGHRFCAQAFAEFLRRVALDKVDPAEA